ncbi:hypothetical protein [Wolbachia endosymbiont (group A) of Pogonocherus hispidulus]|uniref:hypothetical protein n=1 Tax=Wolbachia endosymbiont (group A) of Pogonocherus hispidulus TaxID=3066136 RepID=UPI003341DA1E
MFGDNANADHKDTSQRGKSSEPETPDDKPIKTHTPNQPTTIPDEPKKPVVNPPKTNIKPTGDYPISNLQNANSKTRASYEGELEIINNELWLHFKKP